MKTHDNDAEQNRLAEILQERRICKLGERQAATMRMLARAEGAGREALRAIIPEVGDTQAHPLPALQDLAVADCPRRTLGDISDECAAYLSDEMRLAVSGRMRGLDEVLVYLGANLLPTMRDLMTAKIRTCRTLGNAAAREKLEAAAATLPDFATPSDLELHIAAGGRAIFALVAAWRDGKPCAFPAPEAWRVSFRLALLEDAEGTRLANGYGMETSNMNPKKRSDNGKSHQRREYKDGWRKQKEIADDFNRAKFTPERGARPKGGCTVEKIKQWDDRYTDATHAEPHCGYHVGLRTNPNLKDEYFAALREWREYWVAWRVAFNEWRKEHSASPFRAFRYRPTKRVSVSPDLIGTETDGRQYGTPDGKRKRKP